MAHSENAARTYDLQDRLIGLAAEVTTLCEGLPASALGRHVGGQLVRSGTAPAALRAEARAAESRRDFIHKLRLCLKELRETMSWLQLLRRKGVGGQGAIEDLIAETDQLAAIVYTSVRTAIRNAKTTVARTSDT